MSTVDAPQESSAHGTSAASAYAYRSSSRERRVAPLRACIAPRLCRRAASVTALPMTLPGLPSFGSGVASRASCHAREAPGAFVGGVLGHGPGSFSI